MLLQPPPAHPERPRTTRRASAIVLYAAEFEAGDDHHRRVRRSVPPPLRTRTRRPVGHRPTSPDGGPPDMRRLARTASGVVVRHGVPGVRQHGPRAYLSMSRRQSIRPGVRRPHHSATGPRHCSDRRLGEPSLSRPVRGRGGVCGARLTHRVGADSHVVSVPRSSVSACRMCATRRLDALGQSRVARRGWVDHC